MVPLRLVTRNRWWTLAWAAGICWTAVEVAGSRAGAAADNAASGNVVQPADQAQSDQVNAALAALK